MMNGEGQRIEDAALRRALRMDLPSTEAMARAVRARLAERDATQDARADGAPPTGLVLRFADWTGLSNVAASVMGPALLPLGFARAGATGTLAAKGILPKGLLMPIAIPIAVLSVIGLTLRFALRKTARIEGEKGTKSIAEEALSQWWSSRKRAVGAFGALLLLVNIASIETAAALLALGGIVAHALCTASLSQARLASRRVVIVAAVNVGFPVYYLSFSHRRGMLYAAVTLLTYGVLLLLDLQGRSRFMGPWALMTRATDLDLGKLGGTLLVAVAAPGSLAALVLHVQEAIGSLAEQVWAGRANLAWFAFCLHAVVTSLRAPLVHDN